MYKLKHLLLLSRSDDDAIFHDENEMVVGKITLSKLSWFMPYVMPLLDYKNIVTMMIKNKMKIPVALCVCHAILR